MRCVQLYRLADCTLPDPQIEIPKEILANPVGPAVAALGDAVMEAIVRDTITGLEAYRVGSCIVDLTSITRLIVARVPA